MQPSKADETTIPSLTCVAPDETLDFYRTLGFEVTYEMRKPCVWLAVRRGGIELTFFGDKGLDPKETTSGCLVMVANAEPYHRAFSEAIRSKYGNVPSSGIPRITRFRKGQTRFTVVDPSGNSIVYIRRDEPELEYGGGKRAMSELQRAIATAATFRDFKNDDAGAAKILDIALRRYPSDPPIDRGRALAARAELAVAMEDTECAKSVLDALETLVLSDEDRDRLRDELEAVDDLRRRLTRAGGHG